MQEADPQGWDEAAELGLRADGKPRWEGCRGGAWALVGPMSHPVLGKGRSLLAGPSPLGSLNRGSCLWERPEGHGWEVLLLPRLFSRTDVARAEVPGWP